VAAAIVGNFELYALATSLWMYLGIFHGIGTGYSQRTKGVSLSQFFQNVVWCVNIVNVQMFNLFATDMAGTLSLG
jgi:hypothetical protein